MHKKFDDKLRDGLNAINSRNERLREILFIFHLKSYFDKENGDLYDKEYFKKAEKEIKELIYEAGKNV